ncbi:hypothetical protein B0T25DRAFT_463344 [Lasiosphaeria hispida]|uniref:DnaJ homologue subfamily C member 28 conserved domain-containing protein n=1 Tax=Lasiosphaeria hispida TaxID=260671 RepID=A0AAJ0H943_9PEZI|nr:hypothetical protein B0T25DRAFT_463344 [Lasiosphaeria hispida]
MAPTPFLCSRCIRALCQTSRALAPPPARNSSHSSNPPKPPPTPTTSDHAPDPQPSQGAMSRRLEQATEEALSSRAGRRALESAGFSDDLKNRLLSKIAAANISTPTPPLPDAPGPGTRQHAAARPWTGEEPPADAVLRMLHDARKPLAPGLRGKAKLPEVVVDMRMRGRGGGESPGRRVASARDKAQAYAGMGEGEREARRRELRERLEPAARAMPNTITGLAALANERIEDAIARGQFKNISRGKGVERDMRANNPFIDTTEYIMNNMIKRQEIVPPWIEKQQELLKTAHNFRARLRNDWKRHASRMIASRGGSLQEQMNRAAEYARAEDVYNPRRRKVEQISVPTNSTDDAVMAKIRQTQTSDPSDETPKRGTDSPAPLSRPFRDPEWEATERSYMELAITNLNAITRSYNLMAPELAKKPYFSLQRELENCFAEVAPLLANEIKGRAVKPVGARIEPITRPMGIFEKLGSDGKGSVRVTESKAPHYGFKEFWKDIWGAPKS